MSFEHFTKKRVTRPIEFGKFRVGMKEITDKKNTFEFNNSDFPEMKSIDTRIDVSRNMVTQNTIDTLDSSVSYVNILTKDIVEMEDRNEPCVSDARRILKKKHIAHPIINNYATSTEYKRTPYRFENDEDDYHLRDSDMYNEGGY